MKRHGLPDDHSQVPIGERDQRRRPGGRSTNLGVVSR